MKGCCVYLKEKKNIVKNSYFLIIYCWEDWRFICILSIVCFVSNNNNVCSFWYFENILDIYEFFIFSMCVFLKNR